MRTDVAAPTDSTLASRAGLSVTLYRTGTPLDLIAGTPGLDALSLSPFLENGRQTESEASLDLRYNRELLGANRPKAGQLIQIKDGSAVLFAGMVDAISGERENRGERSMTLTVRRRDATPWWQDVHRISEVFGIGADLGLMTRSIAMNMLGLTDQEFVLPGLGVSLVHDSAQFADVSAWEMLTTVCEPALREPYVNALGVLKTVSRDVRREPDLALSWAQVDRMENSGAKAPATSVRVLWLDPAMSKVYQSEQVLTSASLTAGFFKPFSSTDVWWSRDRTQRAENVVFEVKQSVNSGIVPVGSEYFRQVSDRGGEVVVELGAWVPGLAIASLAALLASSKIPDGVQVGISGTGVTISIGRVAQQISLNAFLLALMTLGHGVYDLKGTPFDFVHAINETVAYDQNARAYSEKSQTIENHLVPDEPGAQALAVNELIYQARAASRGMVRMADDYRVERGDVLGLPDGRRFYATGYSRSLKRGSAAVLDVGGFYL